MLYEGGPVGYAEGGLHDEAMAVRKAGRNGDGRLVHINDDEFADMVAQYGEPTINPETGMPEFFLGGVGKILKKAAKVALPVVVSAIPGAGPIAGAALSAALNAGDALASGQGVKGAIVSGLQGGMSAAGGPTALAGSVLGSGAPSVASSYLTPRTTLLPSTSSLSVDPSTQGLIDGTAGMPFDAKFNFKPETQAALNSVAAQQQQQPAAKKPNFWNQSPLGIKNKYAIPLGLGAAALYDILKKKEDTSMPSREDFFGSSFNGGGGGGFRLASVGGGKSAPSSYEYDEKYFAGGGDVGGEGRSSGRSFAVQGPGTGRSDEIPAMLSDGEYVIDAETVAFLGDGSPKAGAKRLDDFRVQIRKHKGRNLAKGKISHDAKRPEKYMAGGRI